MKTAIVTSKSSLDHNTGSGHPESISRVTSIIDKLRKNQKLIWKLNWEPGSPDEHQDSTFFLEESLKGLKE